MDSTCVFTFRFHMFILRISKCDWILYTSFVFCSLGKLIYYYKLLGVFWTGCAGPKHSLRIWTWPWALMSPGVSPQGTGSVCCSLLRELSVSRECLSSVLAWRIPGTEEPSGLLSMGSHRVRHDWSDLAAQWLSKWSQNNFDIHVRL